MGEVDPQLESLVGSHARKPWSKFVNPENQHLLTPETIDFIDKLLRYDHHDRISPKEMRAVVDSRAGRGGGLSALAVLCCALSQ